MDEFVEDVGGIEQGVDFSKYVRAVVSRWWIILLVTITVSVPWVLYVKKQPPVYQAETLIDFENVAGSVNETVIQSRILRLKSRTVTQSVTSDLGLAVELIRPEQEMELMRDQIFTSLTTNYDPVPGFYFLKIYSNGDCSFYHGNVMLDSLSLHAFTDSVVSYNGVHFQLVPDIGQKRNQVSFLVKDFQSTVESLINRVVIRAIGVGNMMVIKLEGRDPVLISQTVNLLAGKFTQKSLEIKKQQSDFFLNYLQEQLDLAAKELDNSDYQLKQFRNEHLKGLSEETTKAIADLERLEVHNSALMVQKEELEVLLEKLNPSSDHFDPSINIHYIYRQIADLPLFNGDSQMRLNFIQLRDLDQEKRSLLDQGLPELNPEVLEVLDKIALIEDNVYRQALDRIQEVEEEHEENIAKMDSLDQYVNTLPSEEIRQVRLSRIRNANEEIYQLLLKRTKETQISDAVASETPTVLDPAIPPRRPMQGGKSKKMGMGIILGFVLGIGLTIVLEEMDRSIKTKNDVDRYIGLPLLGVIPKVDFDEYELQDSEKAKSISSQIVTHDYSPTPVGEAYRSLRTSLLFSKSFGTIRTLVIGSATPGEGKSFTATNLAIAMAQQKSKTLLIDADLRRGVLHNTFNSPKKPGLTNYLTGVASLEDVLNETFIPNLSLITCGALIPNPSELLGSVKMKRFMEGITKQYDFVIFDTAPLFAATDAVILSTLADGVAVLVRAGETNRNDVKSKIELFKNVNSKLLGVVLNCAGVQIAHDGYSYYRY